MRIVVPTVLSLGAGILANYLFRMDYDAPAWAAHIGGLASSMLVLQVWALIQTTAKDG